MFFLSLLLNGIGAASQAGASRRNAKTNFQINQHNASLERGDSLAALELNRLRNRIELDTATTNAEFEMLNADARDRNAQRITAFAEARTAQGRKALRRQRRQFNQLQGKQRASVGASGVAMEGSVLDVLAESAGQMQLALEDMQEDQNFQRTESLDQATLETFGAAQDRSAAQANLRNANTAFQFGNLGSDIQANRIESRSAAALFGAGQQRQTATSNARSGFLTATTGIFAAGINRKLLTREQNGPTPFGRDRRESSGIFRNQYSGIE